LMFAIAQRQINHIYRPDILRYDIRKQA
jgi:hypothetical protein